MVSDPLSEAPDIGLRPSKIVAVHLNYRSRAEERGRTPSVPSYFLKPPSSLGWDGGKVVRPQGCELLCYEGELAVVIGERARNVTPEQAVAHIGWYSVANDFGVYDLRWADSGSNVMAKGQDGYTPVGPQLVPAGEFDPSSAGIRTYVNGNLAQDDSTGNLIFQPAHLVADLSRFVTLEPGDLILTGTPAGSRPVQPGDLVEVEIDGIGRIRSDIVEAAEPLAELGAMPRVTDAERQAALGSDWQSPALPGETEAALRSVSTATITSQLRKRGIRDTFMQGLRSTRPGRRLVGRAYTLRYVPQREDITCSGPNAQRRAVESIGPGEVLVIEARGELGAATIGDILTLRALKRGAAGVVTDGAIRDSAAIAELDMPTYHRAPHAAVLGLMHHPLETGVPVSCAGVLVMPGDVLVGDDDGVVVVPAAMADDVARDSLEQEEREQFAFERVKAGESTTGLFPLSQERLPEFEEWRSKRSPGGER
jgi:5-oxopent-3-ene-1,2,5-tricarboxylate decarboxylase/2-hydroxyhepta-2,4-diene-1,7-dioate isomerase